ncbi:MAG: winged helix DNA-binding domain-containing protein [Nakamurella sp.]
MQRLTTEQRRARVGVRHQLAAKANGLAPAAIVTELVALHATDVASVYLSLAARATDVHPDAITAALYDDRTLIRMLGMRRTMFVVPTESAAVVQHSSSAAVAARLRRALVKELGVVLSDPDPWLAALEDSVVDLLRSSGGMTGVALGKADDRLRTQLSYAVGKSYGGPAAINSRVLNILSAQGRIVRGRPTGGWTGSRYVWAPVENWLPDGLPELPQEVARAELVRQWLARFGPGTLADLVWWTGWNQGDTRRALAAVETAEVDLDGATGFVLASDAEDVQPAPPWVALLPALDPTPMGWFDRDWYLPAAHRAVLFDRTGNIGPSIWCNGRIVGGWAQRTDGIIGWRLLEDIGTEMTAAVDAEAARLTEWLAGVRVIPSFRTPLERELAV